MVGPTVYQRPRGGFGTANSRRGRDIAGAVAALDTPMSHWHQANDQPALGGDVAATTTSSLVYAMQTDVHSRVSSQICPQNSSWRPGVEGRAVVWTPRREHGGLMP